MHFLPKGFCRATLLLAALLAAAPAPAQVEADVIPNQYIVVLKDEVASPADFGAPVRFRGVTVQHVYSSALKGFAATIPPDQVEAVRRDPRVDFISPDRRVYAFAQTLPTGVNRINAERPFAGSYNRGAGINVAVLDTGVDLTHPDLNIHPTLRKNCMGSGAPNDGNGHGTHVAGIIAAKDNGSGVVGVASSAKVVPVKVLGNDGSGTWSSVICGVDYVTANASKIKVANMSLGGSGSDSPSNSACNNAIGDAMHKAICKSVKAGVTYVVAAGNAGSDLQYSVPAAYDEVIAVTALADSDGKACGNGPATAYGPDDTFASFSNYATLSADKARLLGAPGVSIYSTYRGGGYIYLSGTSMASPHVAGAAALYLSELLALGAPLPSPAAVRTELRNRGEPKGVNFSGDNCGSKSSHTDPSGKHPEPVVRADRY
jgi:subtilisin family serine protease